MKRVRTRDFTVYNFNGKPYAVSICTRILKYRVWKIEFDELDFLSISNSNFAGYTGSKNLVQTRQKFQFIKLNFSNSIFQNPSADRYRNRLIFGIFMSFSKYTTKWCHENAIKNSEIILPFCVMLESKITWECQGFFPVERRRARLAFI